MSRPGRSSAARRRRSGWKSRRPSPPRNLRSPCSIYQWPGGDRGGEEERGRGERRKEERGGKGQVGERKVKGKGRSKREGNQEGEE